MAMATCSVSSSVQKMLGLRKTFTSCRTVQFHRAAVPYNRWLEQQSEASSFQNERRKQMALKVKEEKEKEKRIQEKQEEALQEELRARQNNFLKDKLDEDYFKDKNRFNINDDRDPLLAGLKKEGPDDWKSYFAQGMEETRETYQKMKESQPLTFSQASTKGGRFGYKTYNLGGWLAGGIMLLFIGLACSELRFMYLDNVEEKKALSSFRSK